MAYGREKSAEKRRKESAEGRDIGEIPPIANPERRADAEGSLRRFLEIYFPSKYELAWSDDHLKAIRYLESCIVDGGQFAFAMPRGSGKTTLCEGAATWAIITGRRQFVIFIGSDAGAAVQRLDAIKADLTSNDTLAEDFPEVCYPLRMLEDEPRRCRGQTLGGVRTQSQWGSDHVVLPTVEGSKASAARLEVAGITGGIRGRKFTRPDGKSVRPDLAIVDDPQTDASAKSPSQCAERERVLSKAVLGLAGPGKKIAAAMPCTVIVKGDMADRMLDRKLHPVWQGERMKALYAMPTAMDLWEKYKEIRDDSLRAGNRGREATEFYAANRDAMDAGALVAWPQRHDPGQLSGLESCMIAYLDDPAAFAAERQNEPLEAAEFSELLTAQQIAEKFSRVPRGTVPSGCEYLTAFVDVQEHALYWMVCAFAVDMTGSVIDYGIFPEQTKAGYFTYRDVAATGQRLFMKYPGQGIGGAIASGLADLEKLTLAKTFQREGDAMPMRVSMQLVDAGWGTSTDAIHAYVRRSQFGAALMASKGMGIGASSTPMDEWAKKPGERRGDHWVSSATGGRRTLLFDANHWKSYAHKALATAVGDRGAFTLYGSDAKAHRMVADHFTAEYPVVTEARGRKVNEWKTKPTRDNHWLDCYVGCFVAASVIGAAVPGAVVMPKVEQKALTFADAVKNRTIHKANKRVA